jgi:hypothetical protein
MNYEEHKQTILYRSIHVFPVVISLRVRLQSFVGKLKLRQNTFLSRGTVDHILSSPRVSIIPNIYNIKIYFMMVLTVLIFSTYLVKLC